MLETFLTEYPDDPAADQAAFAAATALLDLRAYKDAAAACDRYADRYPKSDLLDSFWYVVGYCRFASGEHEAALDMCRKVAEATRTDPETGREEPSRNKQQAIYILGQVYHSLGKAADAIREYRRVEDQFVNAKESIACFLRKAIELPEVVALKPGEPAEVELKFRNVAACDLKVYRIDLMKFSLLNRSLGGIAQINLAGIRPHWQETIALGDGKDYRERTRKLLLPLKEEGAYLVVCRGDNLYASGMALVTPLAVEVQADAASGRARATVKDQALDKHLPHVHVKVIGSGNEDFVSGETDLRGVFVADFIRGGVTVIAQAGPSRYAFYRAKEAAVPIVEIAAARRRPTRRRPACPERGGASQGVNDAAGGTIQFDGPGEARTGGGEDQTGPELADATGVRRYAADRRDRLPEGLPSDRNPVGQACHGGGVDRLGHAGEEEPQGSHLEVGPAADARRIGPHLRHPGPGAADHDEGSGGAEIGNARLSGGRPGPAAERHGRPIRPISTR